MPNVFNRHLGGGVKDGVVRMLEHHIEIFSAPPLTYLQQQKIRHLGLLADRVRTASDTDPRLLAVEEWLRLHGSPESIRMGQVDFPMRENLMTFVANLGISMDPDHVPDPDDSLTYFAFAAQLDMASWARDRDQEAAQREQQAETQAQARLQEARELDAVELVELKDQNLQLAGSLAEEQAKNKLLEERVALGEAMYEPPKPKPVRKPARMAA